MPRPLILGYHAVSSSWPSPLAVSEELLAAHARLLRRRRYVGLTLAESERLGSQGALPPRSVVFTFDDGYVSTLRAKPILDEAGFPATVFVVTGFVEGEELLSWPGVAQWSQGSHASELRSLSWPDLAQLLESGWEIGSHSISHPRLPDLSDADLDHELSGSRAAITSHLGTCETIAYPFGLADARVAAAAARAGYIAGVTLTGAHRADTRHLRPRIGLYPGDDGLRMLAKLSPTVTALRRTWFAAGAERVRTMLEQRAIVSRG